MLKINKKIFNIFLSTFLLFSFFPATFAVVKFRGTSSALKISPNTTFSTSSSKTINCFGFGQLNMQSTASYLLNDNLLLTTMFPLTFTNKTASALPMALNGQGNVLSFSYLPGSSLITLQNNVQLNINNTNLKDFNPSSISLGTSSTLTFGDNTRIELGQDLTIGITDMSWTFTGNAEIDGNSATLKINKASGITVTGSKTLTLKNMTLVAGAVDCLKALTDNDRIKLQDVTFVVQNYGYTFATGYLDINGITKITGGYGGLFTRVNFEFASKGNLTIGTNAELVVDSNINLKYNANPGSDTLTYNSKRHMRFSTYTSQLTLNGCSLECTATGLALDSGTMKILDKVTITSTTNSGSEFEIGTQLQVNISAGAALDFSGPTTYLEGPPPTPLRYGDGFALKHNTYGFYFSLGTLYNSSFGTTTLSNQTKFIMMPFNCELSNVVYRWGDGSGGSLLSQIVKSGDIIYFPSYDGTGESMTGRNSNAPVSTPNPPYLAAQRWGYNDAFRIFKKGGSVGDIIYNSDIVYIVDSWNVFSLVPAFLGSSNLAFNSDKEVFLYIIASGFPPSFTTNYLWQIDQHQVGAYSSISNYISNGGVLNTNYSSNWSPFFVPGGAYYVNPATLQV